MKKIIILITLSFINYNYSQSSIVAIYKKDIGNYQSGNFTDSIKNEAQKKGLLSKIELFNRNYHNNAKSVLKKIEFEFKANQKEATFKAINSGLLKEDKAYTSGLISGINTKGLYYSNSSNTYSIHQKSVFRETFLVKKPFLKVKWNLENQTKKIGKFNCLKATAILTETNPKGISKTYNIVCWYTIEVSTNYLGPAGFNGLPGLIVTLKKGNTTLSLKQLTIKKEKIDIKKPQKGIQVENEKEFEKLGTKLFKQMMGKRRKRN